MATEAGTANNSEDADLAGETLVTVSSRKAGLGPWQLDPETWTETQPGARAQRENTGPSRGYAGAGGDSLFTFNSFELCEITEKNLGLGISL